MATLPAAALTALLLAVLTLAQAAPASAHAGLRSSNPAKNSQVNTLAKVSLVFTEPLNPKVIKVQVRDASGGRHETGAPNVAGAGVTQHVTANLAAGRYSVVYRVVSADGHPVQGAIPFTITSTATQTTPPGSAAPPADPAANPATDSGSGSGKWLPIAAVLAAIAVIALGAAALRARRRSHN